MYAQVAWVLVSSGTQVQPQVIIDPDYLPDYLSVLMTMLEYRKSIQQALDIFQSNVEIRLFGQTLYPHWNLQQVATRYIIQHLSAERIQAAAISTNATLCFPHNINSWLNWKWQSLFVQ